MHTKTVPQRIVEYLEALPTRRLTEDDTWPREATQDVIAEAVGVSRGHASLELRRLMGKGKVEAFNGRVRGARRRLRVYRTADGLLAVYNGTGERLPLVRGRTTTVKILVVRCPSCGKESKVAFREE